MYRGRVPKGIWILASIHFAYALSQSLTLLAFGVWGAQNHDPLGLGLTLMAKSAPIVFVALIGGSLADRIAQKKLISGCFCAIAVINIGLAFVLPIYQLGAPTQVLSFISGLAAALAAPALYSILPSLTKKQNLVQSNAIVRSASNTSHIVGPAMGGLLAVNPENIVALLWVCSFCMMIAAFLALLLRPEHAPKTHSASLLQEIKSAPTLLRGYPGILYMLPYWSAYIAITAGVTSVILPVHIISANSSAVWGAMLSASAAGYVAGSISQSVRPIKVRPLFLSVFSSGFIALQLASPILFPGALPLCVVWFISGFASELSGVWWGSYMQKTVPDNILGRVSSIDYSISFGFTPIGYLFVGLISPHLSHNAILFTSAILVCFMALSGCLLAQRLEVYDSRSS